MTESTIAAWILHTLVNVNFTRLTLPPFRADAGKALIIFSFFTYSTIFARSWAARSQHDFTVITSVRKQTIALISSHIINAGALVETWVGGTLVDVSLTVRASESCSACAMIAAGHVLAGSTVHTWVGLALVVIDVTVWSTPSRVTSTFVAIYEILAPTMDARVAAALIHLG